MLVPARYLRLARDTRIHSGVGVGRVLLGAAAGGLRREHQSEMLRRLWGHGRFCPRSVPVLTAEMAGSPRQKLTGRDQSRAEAACAESCPQEQEQCSHEERRGR